MSLIHFNKEGFDKASSASGVMLVDFWASWCGPCKMLAPIIGELAVEFDGKAVIGKVDVDAEMELAQQFGVMSIPTVIVVKDGIEAERVVGVQPKAVYEDLLNQHI